VNFAPIRYVVSTLSFFSGKKCRTSEQGKYDTFTHGVVTLLFSCQDPLNVGSPMYFLSLNLNNSSQFRVGSNGKPDPGNVLVLYLEAKNNPMENDVLSRNFLNAPQRLTPAEELSSLSYVERGN
jgi:hypothetical protein